MAFEIKVLDGELVEGGSVDFYVDLSEDTTAFAYPFKKWVCFAEKNLQYNPYSQGYFYDEGKGEIFDETDSDNCRVDDLKPGRLFVNFYWEDQYGERFQITKVFNILPKTTITIPQDITSGDTVQFNSTTSLNNAGFTWTFSDEAGQISGANPTKDCTIEGYHDVELIFDYTSATHSDGELIVWESDPPDKLANIPQGFLGGGARVNATVTDSISGQILTKKDIAPLIQLNIETSKDPEGESYAPLNSFVRDESVYQLTTDETEPDRIEYIEIDFNDGDVRRSNELGFEYFKTYKRSGTYTGKYTVFTVHELDDGPDYRQSISTTFIVEVQPFFEKWLIEHMNPSIYNSDGFKDLAKGWGLQMDRLYNETQILVDSIDVETIADAFMVPTGNTYGDFQFILEKIGFMGFVEDREGKYDFLQDYNFYDRLRQGDLLPEEKQIFINYIQSTRERLKLKGTPISIERAIAPFGIIADVQELWTNTFEPARENAIVDETFGGDKLIPNTGLNYTNISTPLSYNNETIIVNSVKNSYLEINTSNGSDIFYITDETEVRYVNGKKYFVFDKS